MASRRTRTERVPSDGGRPLLALRRHPAGVPVGGQFAEGIHDDATAPLVGSSSSVAEAVFATRGDSSTGEAYERGFDSAIRVLRRGREDWGVARQISDLRQSLDEGHPGPFGEDFAHGSLDAQIRCLSAMNSGGRIDEERAKTIRLASNPHDPHAVLIASR